MKAITLINHDGSSCFVGVVPASFDVQAWADKRREGFRTLGVVRVRVRDIELPVA